MNIFITGATGFLGHELLKELHRRGHRITALVRSASGLTFPQQTQIVEGRVEDLAAHRQSLRGQDVFVHLAAVVKMWARDRSEFDRVNVHAVEQSVKLAADANIPKFIYTSSFIALGPSNGKPLTEQDARRTNHFHNDYERTKHLGDQCARRLAAEGYPVFILYPGVIYGPGNLTHGNIIARNIIPFLNGWMPFGLALKEWSYVFVGDVVNAFVRVIESDPVSRRYILGGENHTGSSFYQALYDVTGKHPPRVNMPMAIASLAGYGEYLLALLFGRTPLMLTHEVVRIYKHSWAYDSSLAINELNYKITPLHDGLRALVAWLKKAGYVKS